MRFGFNGENFPYTNFHDLNLDWILNVLKEINENYEKAVSAGVKFADPLEWDITKAYEKFTIVMNDNNAYLAMEDVPSGVSISNTDYWQRIFDMSSLEDKIDDLETELREDMDQIEAETLKNNSTRHILWVGDSYTSWYNNKLFNEFVSRCGVPAEQCHNVAVSGAGYTSSQTLTFLQEVQGYAGDKEEITDIIVCGGINDASIDFVTGNPLTARDRLTGAIDVFYSYCQINYPNARIHSAYVGGTMPSSEYYATLHPYVSQQWALWAYTTYSRNKGYNVLKAEIAIHESNDNYNADGIHPSEAYGCIAIGSAVASAFNGNPVTYYRPQDIEFYEPADIVSTSMQHFTNICNDMLTISTPDQYINIVATTTLDPANWTKILEFRRYKIREPHYLSVMVSIRNFNDVSAARIVPATIQILNGEISIKIRSLVEGSYETLVAGQGASITFLAFPDIQCPLWTAN